ncbi:MAG: hypothetical protein K0Q73_4048 [Paenibacillus sp.]|nr:hypothetical protein [Paenibacillus sp.]
MKPFLIGISYSDYVPGMKLYLHQDHESLKKDDIVEVKEISGFNEESRTFEHPHDLFFITQNGVKIIWNKVKVSCYIERNETTSFLESMFDHYGIEADKRMKDVHNYEWTQRNYDDYLEDKHSTLVEMLIEYERKRVSK